MTIKYWLNNLNGPERKAKMMKRAMFLLVALVWLGACESIETEPLPCETPPALDTVQVDTPAPEDGVSLDTGPTIGAVGAACEVDEDCETNQCFTREFLETTAEGFGATWEYDMPGGMCSKLLCIEGQCGDEGFCFDVGPLFGADGMPIGLCMKYCEDYSDCRYMEGYHCYFTGIEGQRACLPAEIIADIPCGDGVCDETEALTPENCPRDCAEE